MGLEFRELPKASFGINGVAHDGGESDRYAATIKALEIDNRHGREAVKAAIEASNSPDVTPVADAIANRVARSNMPPELAGMLGLLDVISPHIRS